MLEYASENSVIKILPERIYFLFDKINLGGTMKRNIKVYNKAPAPIKLIIFPSETEIFTFKHKCLTKLVPGVPLTVTIEFKPTKETEYTDWIRIRCQNDRSIALPVIAVPCAMKKHTMITDTCLEKASFDTRRCLMVNGNKTIKHVKHKKRYRKIIRFKIDSDVTSHKKGLHTGILSKDLETFTQHDVNIALMRKPPPISHPKEQLGPDGSFQNEYLCRRKTYETEFFEQLREIQLLDSSAERNLNVVRLFNPEISSEEIEKVEKYREMQASKDKEISTANGDTHPIYLRQNLITKCVQITDWSPPKQTPDLWIFRYESLWKFIQVARSILIHNRLVKRLEKLKVFVLKLKVC